MSGRIFGFTDRAYCGPAMYGECGCPSAGGTARHCGIVSGAPESAPFCACQCHGNLPTPPPVAPAPRWAIDHGAEYQHYCADRLLADSQSAIAKSKEAVAKADPFGAVERERGCLDVTGFAHVQWHDAEGRRHRLRVEDLPTSGYRDELGAAQTRIRELEAECGRLALELRRATRKAGGK